MPNYNTFVNMQIISFVFLFHQILNPIIAKIPQRINHAAAPQIPQKHRRIIKNTSPKGEVFFMAGQIKFVFYLTIRAEGARFELAVPLTERLLSKQVH